jgi:tRNA(adenine34) deaminase
MRARRIPVSEADRAGMEAALDVAARGAAAGEVPVGAVVVVDGRVVSEAHNETIARRDLTQHAELLAIQRALRSLGTDRLDQATLYVTLEPCAQCAGAMVLARVGKVVFGAYDPKAGMAGSVGDLLRHPRLNHRPEVRGGVLAEACGELLSRFFAERRDGRGGVRGGGVEPGTASQPD